MTTEELAHLDDLSLAFLRQLKRDMVVERKRREARNSPRHEGRASDALAGLVGASSALPGESTSYQEAPKAKVVKRKVNELDSSNSRDSPEPAIRHSDSVSTRYFEGSST
jgi:hypothetical protein